MKVQKITRPLPKFRFTKEGYAAIIKENQALLLKRKDVVESVRKARDMGDLSENGYYKAAKGELVATDRRLRELKGLIRFGEIQTTHTGQIGIGSKVIIEQDGKTTEYSIVGDFEANPSQGKISTKSPIGKSLFGKKAGDFAIIYIPSGKAVYKILKVN